MFFSLDTVDLIHLFFPAKLFAQHFVLSSVDSKCLLIKYNNNKKKTTKVVIFFFLLYQKNKTKPQTHIFTWKVLCGNEPT